MSNEEEYNTTASFQDLMDEDEDLFTQEATIRTGAGGNVNAAVPRHSTENPNAHRWLFNPFEVIDLRNESASCGMPFVENVVFNCVKSIEMKTPLPDVLVLPTSAAHSESNYISFLRTAEMIATELCGKHGDKGVIELRELVGADDDFPAFLNVLLFGAEVECAFDVNNPDQPVPILPNLLELLETNLRDILADDDAQLKETARRTARQLRSSITVAAGSARARISAAQKRMLDLKNPNRTLSADEKRCYLALGEEIPNQMPLLTRSAQNAPMNTADLATAVAAGVAAALNHPSMMPVSQAQASQAQASQAQVAAMQNAPDESFIRVGQEVIADGQPGKVVGKVFGKLKVDFGANSKMFTKEEVSQV